MRKKNKFWTFCFSFIPGAGQMFQGRLRRGASIMGTFAVVIVLGDIISGALTALLPVIWFLSFFDSLNNINKTEDELAALGDRCIWDLSRYPELQKYTEKKNLFAGILIILLGVSMLYQTIVWPVLRHYELFFINTLVDKIPPVLVGAAIVAIGVRLVMGKKEA